MEGLQVHINKNAKQSPHHAMSFAAKRYTVTFLHDYAEDKSGGSCKMLGGLKIVKEMLLITDI